MKKITNKKKIIIIGAGIAGLTAGIYALNNGFDVEIYEKHVIAGGECTGWYRDNTFIDGCAHWIVGTNPKSQLFPLWKYVGAFDENSKIYETDYFDKFDIEGNIVTFYSDRKLLKQELLRISPSDKKQINTFIKGIKAYSHVQIPVKKPLDKMNVFDYIPFGIKMLPMARSYFKYTKLPIREFASRCSSPLLQKVFTTAMYGEFNLHSLLYVMQELSKKNAGVVEGGSLEIIKRMTKRFNDLGGNLFLKAPTKKIIIIDNKAKGIELENGDTHYADYIISTADMHHTLYDLLEHKYKVDYYENKFNNRKEYPLPQTLQASYKITKDIKDLPKMITFRINPFTVGNDEVVKLTLRNHSFDESLNDGHSTITTLIRTHDTLYDILKNMTKEEYKAWKNNIGNIVKEEIKKYYDISEDEIKFLDLTTPLTYERYCNAYRGSFMSFISTSSHDKLMHTGLIDNLDNFLMAGQWIMPPGGLPIALFTAKHSIYRICKFEHMKFKHE